MDSGLDSGLVWCHCSAKGAYHAPCMEAQKLNCPAISTRYIHGVGTGTSPCMRLNFDDCGVGDPQH